jgi:hypothetical protein
MSFASPSPEVAIPSIGLYDYVFGRIHDAHLDRIALVDVKSGRQTSCRDLIAHVDLFGGAIGTEPHRSARWGGLFRVRSPNWFIPTPARKTTSPPTVSARPANNGSRDPT